MALINSSVHDQAKTDIAMKTIMSTDGIVTYRQLGHGPGLIILHGAMQRWHSHIDLAELLADSFTVYLPDRRGRGKTSPAGPNYSVQTEVEDLASLAHATGARLVFGVSIGALIAIQSCLKLRGWFYKAAIWEAPVLIDPPRHNRYLNQMKAELAQGDLAGAILTGMGVAQMGALPLRLMPYWMARPIINWFLARGTPQADELRALAPTMVADLTVVSDMEKVETEAANITETEVLIMSGTMTHIHLARSSEWLERSIPEATHVQFAGLGHLGAGNKAMGGKPDIVAEELRAFYFSAIDDTSTDYSSC
jgi:pimeloyl-ACP methyl ester carboxylesterase